MPGKYHDQNAGRRIVHDPVVSQFELFRLQVNVRLRDPTAINIYQATNSSLPLNIETTLLPPTFAIRGGPAGDFLGDRGVPIVNTVVDSTPDQRQPKRDKN